MSTILKGLALGVYPAVCLLLDQYKAGANFQQLEFEDLLYDLMCSGPEPYLTGSISNRQFLDIVSRKDYNGWNDLRLHKILAIRLGDSYEFVLERLNEVWETFEKLETLLQIQEYHGYTEPADYWQFQLQRAKQTWFQPTYLENCRKMGDQISQIKHRVASCDQRREREMGANTDSFGNFMALPL
ncbi:hypothetical protein B7463_g3564, partial [Scytalidium lignicola]